MAWRELLLVFGSKTLDGVVVIVVAFLGRSLVQTWLAKDIKKFESDLRNTADHELERLKQELKFKGDASIEQLKSKLQQEAVEHQVRFSNLHERRAEVIADIYKHLVEASWEGERFVFQTGSEDKQSMYFATQKRIIDFYEFVDSHRIYLSEPVCRLLENFINILKKPVIEVHVYGTIDHPTPQTIKERNEAFSKAYAAFKDDIPTARKALEEEFRRMLGAAG
jgi:hypothetical protein